MSANTVTSIRNNNRFFVIQAQFLINCYCFFTVRGVSIKNNPKAPIEIGAAAICLRGRFAVNEKS